MDKLSAQMITRENQFKNLDNAPLGVLNKIGQLTKISQPR
jgi:hypothetical protein